MEMLTGIWSIVLVCTLHKGLIKDAAGNDHHFKQARCFQTKSEVYCEDIISREESTVSYWPPGPYYLPMPVTGCPEASTQGWKTGYISATWRTSHAIYITNHSAAAIASNTGDTDVAELVDITVINRLDFPTVVYGPLRPYVLRLNFCHKEERNERLDVGNLLWPAGNYSIYGDNTGCPEGFLSYNSTINLGEINYWTSDGYVPDFVMEEVNGTAKLWITLCSRLSDATAGNSTASLPNSFFMLLKHDLAPCPSFNNFSLAEENIFLGGVSSENTTDCTEFQSYCFYTPEEWNTDIAKSLLEKMEKDAHMVTTSQLIEGKQTVLRGNFQDESGGVLYAVKVTHQNKFYVPWKLVDLGRTLSVTAVRILFPSGTQYYSTVEHVPQCHISKEKWCFLHFCSYKCMFKTYYENVPTTLQLLFLRSLNGRYIALTAAESLANKTLQDSTGIDIFTDQHNYGSKSNCNSDLGMADGGIVNVQISASSFQQEFPPSSARPYYNGWCADSFDTQPYIQVDLVIATVVEGVTVWNWQQVVTTGDATVWDTVVHFGVNTLKVAYGDTADSLFEYNKKFRFDRTRPFDEPQTFWLIKSTIARYIRLEIIRSITPGLNCLRFELHGCRIEGIPLMKCSTKGSMFHLSKLPVPPSGLIGMYHGWNFSACEKLCLQDNNCSSVAFTNNNMCISYGLSKNENYQLLKTSTLENWSTKFCFEDQFSTVPTLTEMEEEELSSANVMQLADEGAITSMGYPFLYSSGQLYKWIILFESSNYVKLIFTNISLHIYEDTAESSGDCTDEILISKEIIHNREVARIIDSRFNGPVSVIETSESLIVITFETCLPTAKRKLDGYGFRAIVIKQNLPACFTLDSPLSWETGREEVCLQPSMILTSMSLLGLPFSGTTEQWTITTNGRRIHLVIEEFQVACKTDESGSEFFIRDLGVENRYCNLNKPPDEIYSSSDTVLVSFFKGEDPPYATFKEGFRLVYSSKRVSMEHLISYQQPRPNIINVALGKPAIMSSLYIYQYPAFLSAGKGTDGTVHLDAAFGACFHTKEEIEPWWMVDLQGIYIIDRIVLYNKQENIAGVLARNIEISVGTEVTAMRVTSYFCQRRSIDYRKAFDQNGIRGRFVKLQIKYLKQKFHLCEVEVYGVIESEVDERSKREFKFPDPVQGNWGIWGPWSNICYCNGTQPRARICDNPSPSFGGSYCAGSNMDYRECTSSENCKISNVALGKRSSTSSSEYSWSTADLATDNSTIQAPRSCFQTKFEYQPWWMIDLEGVFELEEIVIYKRAGCCGGRARNLEISVGVGCEWTVVYYKCGKYWGSQEAVSLIGSTARFVKIQIVGLKEYLNLCEIQIYGQPAKSDSSETSSVKCRRDTEVDGQYSTWSQWSSCSENCGIGKMTRTRVCDNPSPSNGGRPCFGDDTEISNCVGGANCPICSERFGKCYSIFPELTNWNHAGNECWKRKMKLVSIRSEEELQFIKFLLRENRYRDKQPIATFDSVYTNASYLTHIGLYRLSLENGVKLDMWEDRTPVTFTAWKSGEPSKGNCARMNYKSFDDTNTWESEDCFSTLAEYFICEHLQILSQLTYEDLPEKHGRDWIKIPEQIKASQYTGKVNRTKSGKECDAWIKQADDPYAIIWWQDYIDRWQLEETTAEAENYCRDPGGERYLWCNYQTADNKTKREECSVLYPTVKNTQNFNWKYFGKWNKTYTGKTCQRWDVTIPHGHDTIGFSFPGEKIGNVENYCRDTWNSGYLWCYTTDQDTRWEFCIVEDNPEDRCLMVRNIYSGNWSKSFSGKDCRRWDENQHRIPERSDELMFPDGSVSAAATYCRDPLGNGYLWCYVHEYDGSWEPCLFDDTDQLPARAYAFEIRDRFRCRTGEEILLRNKCDEKFDCEDLSDESRCLDDYKVQDLTATEPESSLNSSEIPKNFVLSSHFQCDTGEWISVTARCDRLKDCLDASDELNCSWSSTGISRCSYDQFQCGDDDCIHISQVCNFVDDCINRSDEYCDIDECGQTEYQCSNGQCVSLEKQCNGFKDCGDGSDEAFCDTCRSDVAFHCDIVRCIPIRLVCDQYKDCEDGGDESSCKQHEYTSCEQWWEAGYRKSGPYIIGGLMVDCDFDSVRSKKKMYTIVRNFDILWRDGDGVGYLYTRDTLREEDIRLNEILKRPHYQCVQQVTQSCIPSHDAATEFDDPQHENTFRHCKCISMTILIEQHSEIGHCYSKDSGSVDKNDLIFTYNASLSIYRKVILKGNKDVVHQGYQIVPGSAVCEYNYVMDENVTICEGDVKVVPTSNHCLYDEDAAGYKTGCRSGSHLQNCNNFKCKEGNVKCPNSYCIPLRFVCDGEVQCPGGEDEHGCGCEETESEVLLVYDSESDFLQKLDVYRFAKQFKTAKNIVRLLKFVATQPLQDFNLDDVIIQVTDTEIQPMSTLNRIEECKYNVMAKNLVKDMRFSENKSRGMIYIGDHSESSNDLYNTFFSNVISDGLNMTLYRVIEKPMTDLKLESIPYVTDVVVKRWSILNTVGAEYFPEFCKARTKVKCSHKYKCKWSKRCIPMNQVCDGQTQCTHGDDEHLCDFICPNKCTCIGYTAHCRDSGFNLTRTSNIPVATRLLDLSLNEDLKDIMKGSYLNLMVLVTLNLSSCNIGDLSRFAFRKIRNVVTLDLSFNSIFEIRKSTFSYLSHLRILRLEGNRDLSVIEPGAFESLSDIRDLNFGGARLTKISAYTFTGLVLQTIDLSNNSIKEIENFAFSDLTVKSINFERNAISFFRKEIFTGVTALESLRTPAFKFCCIRPNYLPENGCYPPKDEFSSCDDLMRLSALQTMLWLIGLSSLFGNALTIWYRITYDRERLKLGFGIFVTNLAAADFLMGVYLLIIAIADAAFRKRYIFMDDYWRNSAWCNLAGVLSTISSEASVFFLCLITLDRLLVIKFPFGEMRFDKRRSTISAGAVWVFSIFFAILPVIYESYFKNKFYTKSGVCIALPLTRDRPPGWMYSVAIFVGLNFATFVLVAFGQWSIFMEIRKASSEIAKTTAGRKNDLKVARNLLLVVLTDFLCWFPIGVMGIMALSGHVISGDVYAWSAVFILPINSALNPILYTVSAIIGRKTFNPSTQEQSRSDITKELGTHILNFQRVSRHFSVRRKHSSFRRINSIIQMEQDLEPTTVLKVAMQLAKCLDVLHNSYLVIGDLNTYTVCLSVSKKGVSGDVQLETEPRVSSPSEDAPGDMFQVGKIVRVLLSKCRKTRK